MEYPNDLTVNDIANLEHNWVKNELDWCDRQISLHQSGDDRAVKSLDELYKYSRDLRNYTTVNNGQAEILTDKPVLT